jgi:hypothetical protein
MNARFRSPSIAVRCNSAFHVRAPHLCLPCKCAAPLLTAQVHRTILARRAMHRTSLASRARVSVTRTHPADTDTPLRLRCLVQLHHHPLPICSPPQHRCLALCVSMPPLHVPARRTKRALALVHSSVYVRANGRASYSAQSIVLCACPLHHSHHIPRVSAMCAASSVPCTQPLLAD